MLSFESMALTSERTADLIFLLTSAGRSLEIEAAIELQKIGTTPRSYCVLSKAREGEFTQIELAKRCGLDKTTMVVAIDELESAGLAERRPSPTDRRARVIAVTPAGHEMAARGRDVMANLYADVLDALPEDERLPFVTALSQLAEGRLANPPECESPPRRRRSTG